MNTENTTTANTTEAAEKLVISHKWEDAGHGKAPFRPVCVISVPAVSLCEANPEAYNRAMAEAMQCAKGFGVSLCTCDVCGMSLMNNVVIRDANGKHFVVGLDCAGKSGDAKLITQTEKLEKARQFKIREAKKKAELEARQAARLAALQAERDANGGLTNAELAEKNRRDAAQALADKSRIENDWLIQVLANEFQGDFVRAMIANLSEKPLHSAIRGRAAEICGEIYGKQKGGRKGSKAYEAANAEFWTRYNEGLTEV